MTLQEKLEIIEHISGCEFDDESRSHWERFIQNLPDYDEVIISKHTRTLDSIYISRLYEMRHGLGNRERFPDSKYEYFGFENSVRRLRKYGLPVLLVGFHYETTYGICFRTEDERTVLGFLYVQPE